MYTGAPIRAMRVTNASIVDTKLQNVEKSEESSIDMHMSALRPSSKQPPIMNSMTIIIYFFG